MPVPNIHIREWLACPGRAWGAMARGRKKPRFVRTRAIGGETRAQTLEDIYFYIYLIREMMDLGGLTLTGRLSVTNCAMMMMGVTYEQVMRKTVEGLHNMGAITLTKRELTRLKQWERDAPKGVAESVIHGYNDIDWVIKWLEQKGAPGEIVACLRKYAPWLKEIVQRRNRAAHSTVVIHYDDAELMYEKLVSFVQCMVSAIDSTGRGHHALMGATHLRVGDHKAAITCFGLALDENPDNTYALALKGEVLAEMGRFGDALGCFEKALEIKRDTAFVLGRKGYVLAKMGRLDDARACLDSSLAADPSDPYVLVLKGMVLARLGRHGESLECLDSALGMIGEYFDLVLHKAYSELVAEGNFSAISTYKTKFDALTRKGRSLAELGRHEDAVTCLDLALGLDPDNPRTLTYKGASLAELGRRRDALECISRALELDPDSPFASRMWSELTSNFDA